MRAALLLSLIAAVTATPASTKRRTYSEYLAIAHEHHEHEAYLSAASRQHNKPKYDERGPGGYAGVTWMEEMHERADPEQMGAMMAAEDPPKTPCECFSAGISSALTAFECSPMACRRFLRLEDIRTPACSLIVFDSRIVIG